jgi:hypothetical protein
MTRSTSSNTRHMLPDEFRMKHDKLQWDVDYWRSYTLQGLRGEIEGNTRKDQRLYQRCFCAAYSRLHRFREQHPEYLI